MELDDTDLLMRILLISICILSEATYSLLFKAPRGRYHNRGMSLRTIKHIYMSIKRKLFLLRVLFAVLTLAILIFEAWNNFSNDNEQKRPCTSAMRGSLSFKHSKYNSLKEDDSASFTEKKFNLVDVPQLFGDPVSDYNITDKPKTNVTLKILWFKKPIWFGGEEEVCNRNIRRCFQGNCLVTYNRSLLKDAHAIIFDASASTFPQYPPLTPGERDPNQVWIFYGLESPFNYQTQHFKKSWWRSMFNWTMTYRLDADIPHPYGILLKNHHPPERNYMAIFRAKTKFAAWIVSNCNSVSGRNEFVRLLQNYISVDIFGHCGTKSCPTKGNECRDSIGNDYKFYLSFENSLCKDYITEKFFNYFPLDLITVQRGYSDYNAHLPNDTYINSANFSTVQELANFMTRLAEDEDQFIRYLKCKDRYMSKGFSWTYCNALCNICNKLNHLEKYRRSYNDIGHWLESNTCSSVSDIR